MKRVLTAALSIPLALAAIFYLPETGFLVAVLVLMEICAVELVVLGRRLAPGAPLRALPVLVPIAVLLIAPDLPWIDTWGSASELALLTGGLVAFLGAVFVLLGRTPVEDVAAGLGLLCFGVPYLALPTASLSWVQSFDPWWLVLLVAIVWGGDTAAFYVGTFAGKRKLAPTISPNKTWVGAAASLMAAVLISAVWNWWRLGEIDPAVIILGGVTGIAAQIGDLVESMLKRAAGIKDSGRLLPGHGGMLDRMDALLFAAPVFALLLGRLAPELWRQ